LASPIKDSSPGTTTDEDAQQIKEMIQAIKAKAGPGTKTTGLKM
jgi:hypothetical protein